MGERVRGAIRAWQGLVIFVVEALVVSAAAAVAVAVSWAVLLLV